MLAVQVAPPGQILAFWYRRRGSTINSWSCLEVVVSYEHQFDTFLGNYRQCLVRLPAFLPRDPPGQAVAIARGSYCKRALWRLHMLHRMLSCHAMYPHIPPWASRQVAKHPQHPAPPLQVHLEAMPL